MTDSIADQLGEAVPYLRRYARALTGSRVTGDRYGAAAIEARLASSGALDAGESAKVALFRAFHVIWSSAGAPISEENSHLALRAQERMSILTPFSREALLLHVIEGFEMADVARILMISVKDAEQFIGAARQEMQKAMLGKIMVIEDEGIIAMELVSIIEEMGHHTTGVARTHREALVLATKEPPDLILADIELADKSSGIEAVHQIQTQFEALPAIFVSAYPELLLRGEDSEPAFVISKPFSPEQIRSAVSQAMFFSSTATLLA